MTRRFSPSRAYEPQLDIRFVNGQTPSWAVPLVQGRPPNTRCWIVVMPRRAGKSWLASAIMHTRPVGTSHRVDLRLSRTELEGGLHCLLDGRGTPRFNSGVLLVDEPGLRLSDGPGNDPQKLAKGLRKFRDAGVVPIVLTTPFEYDLLIKYLGSDGHRDLILPDKLNGSEVARLAAREQDWAPRVVEEIRAVDSRWLQTPFLLELVLHIAEEDPSLRTNIPSLLTASAHEANGNHEYRRQVFNNGLSPEQRAELRGRRWQTAGVNLRLQSIEPTLLRRTVVPDDPIVAHHLPDVLRIHHISDLHHGGNLRKNVDAKDESEAGRRIAEKVGAGSPLDSYLKHVNQLATDGRAPHLVIVTGDIVNRPNDAVGEEAVAWLEELNSLLADHEDLRPEDPRIVLVGGNHDVSWDLCLDPDRHRRHRWFADMFGDYPHPDLQESDARERRLSLKYPDAGLRLFLLGSAESGGEAARDEDRQLLENKQAELATADNEMSARDLILDFARLDPGVISKTILDRLTFEAGWVTLAALHHPLSPVPSVEITPYSGIVNAGQAKRALTSARTAVVLHGHTHLSFLAAERFLGTGRDDWTMRIVGAPTLASAASDEQNGYNQILLAREGGGHTVVVQPVRVDGGQWVPDRGICFRPGEPNESWAHMCSDPVEV